MTSFAQEKNSQQALYTDTKGWGRRCWVDVITQITLQCSYIDLAPTNPREIHDCVHVNVGSFINNDNQSHEILENLLCVMLIKKLRSF